MKRHNSIKTTHPLRILSAILILAGLFGTAIARADFLYVGDGADDTVKRFDANTGGYLGTFVAPGSGGLNGPRGLIFTQSRLHASNQNVNQDFAGEILQYSRRTGAFLGALVPCNPPLNRDCDPNAPFAPRGLIKGLGHTLYVADLGFFTEDFPGNVSQFDTKTGDFLGNLDPTGFNASFFPRGIVRGPDGLIYIWSSAT